MAVYQARLSFKITRININPTPFFDFRQNGGKEVAAALFGINQKCSKYKRFEVHSDYK